MLPFEDFMILLASTSQPVLTRWRCALRGLTAVSEVDSKPALMQTLKESQPTIVFLDSDCAEFGKISLIKEIARHCARARIVVLTHSPTLNNAIRAVNYGAKGYTTKNLNKELIAKCYKALMKGEIWISRQHMSALAEEYQRLKEQKQHLSFTLPDTNNGSQMPYDLGTLSPREFEIASLVGTGLPNKAISGKLNITERTVKAHLTKIFQKVGITGRTELAIAIMTRLGPTNSITVS